VNEPRNPYSPPAAEVADAQVEGALEGQEALIPNGRVVPIGNGVRWLTNAMRLYFQQPLKWTGVVLLLGLLSFVVAFIPFFNFLTTVLWPVIGGGIMLALSLQRRTGSFTINDIFAGFGPRFGSLALVGVVMLLMYPILFASFAIFVGADIAGAVTESASARQIDPALVMTTNFLLAILVYLLFALPLLLATYLAPPLIMLHGVPTGTAIKMSFIGGIKNILAGIVYGIVLLLLLFISAIPLGLGLLASIPIMMISCYTTYRDIFLAES